MWMKGIPMSTIQRHSRRSRWWLAALGLVSVSVVSAWCWSSFNAPVTDWTTAASPSTASSGVVPTVASQQPTAEALSVAEKVVAAAVEGQKEAAQVVARQPEELTPIVGKVKERPPYVSVMEWDMLKGVAEQHEKPDQELTHLVNYLRFTKKLELYQGLSPSQAPARRMALAEQLIQELPTRLRQGDMDLKEAQRLLAEMLEDAVLDAQARQVRSTTEQAKLAKVMASTLP